MGARMIEIRPCTAADILAPENRDLISQYAAECAISGMPEPTGHLTTYRLLEQHSSIVCMGVYADSVMVGFGVALQNTLPHYGVKATIIESVFVLEHYRKGGAGARLIRELETAWLDSAGVLISAPVGGHLCRVLPGFGYRHTNQVFFKERQRA
jgi:GNAT superfamily N-acetyltransferase